MGRGQEGQGRDAGWAEGLGGLGARWVRGPCRQGDWRDTDCGGEASGPVLPGGQRRQMAREQRQAVGRRKRGRGPGACQVRVQGQTTRWVRIRGGGAGWGCGGVAARSHECRGWGWSPLAACLGCCSQPRGASRQTQPPLSCGPRLRICQQNPL